MGCYNMDLALEALTVPAYILGGGRDSLTPVKACKIIKQHLVHANYCIFAGEGHNLLQDSPAAVESIVRFLTTLDLPCPSATSYSSPSNGNDAHPSKL
jgi:pimeloyl-ACP methyl ester carboxylesterase